MCQIIALFEGKVKNNVTKKQQMLQKYVNDILYKLHFKRISFFFIFLSNNYVTFFYFLLFPIYYIAFCNLISFYLGIAI